GGERENDGEARVRAELAKSLVRAVGARGEPVGAEPHPGQERRQRQLVERFFADVLGATEEEAPELGEQGSVKAPERMPGAQDTTNACEEKRTKAGCARISKGGPFPRAPGKTASPTWLMPGSRPGGGSGSLRGALSLRLHPDHRRGLFRASRRE